MKNKRKNIENVFILEITNSCNFNCPGCNINKTKEKKQLISNQDLNFLNKVLLNYYNYNYKYYKDLDLVEILLFFGPGDFFSYFTQEEIINISNTFSKKFSLLYAGNYSTQDLRLKMENVLKHIKNFQEINFNIIFNPFLKEEEEKILKTNYEKMLELKEKYESIKKFKIDISATVNLSKKYFDDINNIEFSLNKAMDIGFKKVAFAFAPSKLILKIRKEDFDINLEKINKWFLEYFKTLLKDKYYNYFDESMLLNIKGKNLLDIIQKEKTYKNYEEIYSNMTHEFVIDSKLNISIVKDHLGEFFYDYKNGLKPLFNIKEKGENALNDLYNNISYLKYRLDDYKFLIKDEQCKNCKYILHCANMGIGHIEATYKDIFGSKNENFCYGYKNCLKYIENNYDKYKKFFKYIDKYYDEMLKIKDSK